MAFIIGFILCFVSPFIGIPILIYAFFSLFSGSGGGASNNSSNNNTNSSGAHKLQFRLIDVQLGENNDKFWAKEVQAKGPIPLNKTTNVSFITSVFDMTSEEPGIILSTVDSFQEKENRVYQNQLNYGQIPINQEFPDWARVGLVIPEILQPPRGGDRKLAIVVRMVDLDNMPEIKYGYCDTDQSGVLWQDDIKFNHVFTDKGYEEVTEHHEESVGLIVKIGTAIAMDDHRIEDSKGYVLKKWISSYIDIYSGEKKERLKELCNDALKEAYSLAKNGDLSMSKLTSRFNDIGTNSEKYQAIELCFDILGAGGNVNSTGLENIRLVASALNLDLSEVKKIHDTKIIEFNPSNIAGVSIESILGIESHWDFNTIKKHLRDEFQKWNNRLNTLSEGPERDNAQMMLDRIAEARKKYA